MAEEEQCNQFKKYQDYFEKQSDIMKKYDETLFDRWLHGEKGVIDQPPQHQGERRCIDFNCCHSEMDSTYSMYCQTSRVPYCHQHYSYTRYLQPPILCTSNPGINITTKFVHTSINKNKTPVYCMRWTPDGRRIVTGNEKGEFTFWNGLQFNFACLSGAHDTAVRCMTWSHSGGHMVSGEQGSNGSSSIIYWNPSLAPVVTLKTAHSELIREVSFSPNDLRFASCSDDKTIGIWDFNKQVCEIRFDESENAVYSVDWHPTESLLLSSSKGKVRIWDPRLKEKVGMFSPHKTEINKVRWNKNGKWFLTCSKDFKIILHDIRMFNKPLMIFEKHMKDVTIVNWHPIQEDFFVSGGANGVIYFWDTEHSKPIGEIPVAHDGAIWDLQWHPVGHLLASCAHDQTTKFWSRDRCGDSLEIKKYQGTNRDYDPIIPMYDDDLEQPYLAPVFIPNQINPSRINGFHDI
ncbi:hypothetical protein ENUP19_0244G0004 [Entamoeba nuttalli]|uniref:WD domain, G-beta repeat-containing protein n=2 Tax=Entamoeba nuttalli TaxID=412467 RepID=K2GFD8_ENTNP|nr:WD domain, G-beta repeat-containing protein [Entamoeba nuttalli P19]EKE41386.1 WD domain, G-beta repeat-containing protein [Entamoeba nuttalli P19]|eukprot:XP_008856278.1 WD domain, G-beta repeat-containing protein [Entamoeba nuttalli P19]